MRRRLHYLAPTNRQWDKVMSLPRKERSLELTLVHKLSMEVQGCLQNNSTVPQLWSLHMQLLTEPFQDITSLQMHLSIQISLDQTLDSNQFQLSWIVEFVVVVQIRDRLQKKLLLQKLQLTALKWRDSEWKLIYWV